MPLAGHGLRPPALRRRASRPQLKRDPLGGNHHLSELSVLLVAYVDALSAADATTHRAEERPVLQKRLAAAAQMFAALHRDDRRALVALVNNEGASWTVPGLPGDTSRGAAITAFEALAREARRSVAT